MALPAKIKSEYCPNCGGPLNENYNYCPICGQENHHPKPGIKTILYEFIGEAGGIDSGFLRTLKELIFKPGALTLHYLANRKASYVLPSKLYLLFSFIFFFLITFSIDQIGDENVSFFNNNAPNKTVEFNLSDSISFSANKIDSLIELPGSLDHKIDSMILASGDTTVSWLEHKFLKATLLYTAGKISGKEMLGSFIQNVSIAMFILMPFFALLLLVLYIRRRLYYADHLIFSIHFHSFIFFIFSLWVLTMLFLTNGWIHVFFLSVITIYFIAGLRNVYVQSWRKTIFKAFLLILIYTLVLVVIVGFAFIFTVINV